MIRISTVVLAFSLFNGFSAFAEDKTCVVKGMHCEGCTEMVQGKVCEEGKYSTCEIKITDEAKELGQIHVVTKDEKAKVDEKAIKAAVIDAGYKMQSCAATKSKAPAKATPKKAS